MFLEPVRAAGRSHQRPSDPADARRETDLAHAGRAGGAAPEPAAVGDDDGGPARAGPGLRSDHDHRHSDPDRHPVPAGVRPRRVLGSAGHQHRRRHRRLRSARLQRARREPDRARRRTGRAHAQRRSRARSALGPHRGILRRRPVPDRRDGQELHHRPARHRPQVPARGVVAEALHGQQQRRHAHDQLVEPRRSQPARVLLCVVRDARCAAAPTR